MVDERERERERLRERRVRIAENCRGSTPMSSEQQSANALRELPEGEKRTT
jgi:hypothetical protein